MTTQVEIEPHPLYTLNPDLTTLVLPGYAQPLPLDIETNGGICWQHRIRIISLHINGKEFLIIPEYYSKEELVSFFQRVKKNNNLIICHKTKFDCGFIFVHYGVMLDNLWCTLIGSQVIHGGARIFKNTLDSCLNEFLHVVIENKEEMQKSFLNDKPLTPEQLAYAAGDTRYLIPLKARMEEEIAAQGLEKIIKLENKLTPVLIEMEAKGCLIDIVKWKSKIKEWEQTKKKIVEDLDAEVLRVYPWLLFTNVNYSSPKQIIGLFKKLKLPAPLKEDAKTKEEKESVDEGAINNYLNNHPESPLADFITRLKDYREYDKLISTYGDSFLERLDENNHIHCEYGQCTTGTARLNSYNPNLQNIPSDKSGEGSVVREYFLAPEGYSMLTSDMSGAEIALAADFSKDELLMRSIKEGIDMHSELASISAGIIYGQQVKISKSKEPITVRGITLVPNEFRDIHKSVTFAKFYRGGAKRVYEILARYINPIVPAKRRMYVSKQISEAIDRALPKLSKFLEKLIEEANTKGYLVTTKLGRRRKFTTKVYGEAANAPIQASNGDAIKIAMINIHKYLQGKGRIVLTIHDELVVIVEDRYAEEATEFVKNEMAKSLTYFLEDLKGEATVKISKHWQK